MSGIALNRSQLDLLIEELLKKVKETAAVVVSEEDFASKSEWNDFLMSILEDNVDADYDNRAVTILTLTELLSFANYSRLEIVKGNAINAVVKNPLPNAIYLLRNPESDDKNTLWAYDDQGNWVSLTKNIEVPDIHFVDTKTPEAVQNIVSHVNRGTGDYAASTNVKADDTVNVQALTNVLIGLAGAQIKTVPYSESKGRSISKVVTKPSLNTIYLYQQSSDENDWAVYTVAAVTVDSLEKTVWIKVSGGAEGSGSGSTGSGNVAAELGNYWSKDELVPLTDDEIIDIVNEAAIKAGF